LRLGTDPPDTKRLELCRTMVVSVRRQLVAEEVKAQARVATERPTDPYGAKGGSQSAGPSCMWLSTYLSWPSGPSSALWPNAA
jgi:hypothetical protein